MNEEIEKPILYLVLDSTDGTITKFGRVTPELLRRILDDPNLALFRWQELWMVQAMIKQTW